LNLHEGSRSEYFAQYIFSSLGTCFPVPHQEDTGLDLYCTLLERIGQRAWPRHYYSVQVKSTDASWEFNSQESARWLIEFPLPIFLCIVTKPTATLRVYHTSPRFYAWAHPPFPDTLTLRPGDGPEGRCTQWRVGPLFPSVPPSSNSTSL